MTEASKRKCPLCQMTIKQCWSWGGKDAEEEMQKREEVRQKREQETSKKDLAVTI